jgi:hypothetical protein
MHPGIHAPKQQTQMETWLQLSSQFQSVHCRSWLFIFRYSNLLALVRGVSVRLASAAYRIVLDVGLSEKFFCHRK